MLSKSADPTPTITIDSGKLEQATILSTVLAISEITPSYNNTIMALGHSIGYYVWLRMT